MSSDREAVNGKLRPSAGTGLSAPPPHDAPSGAEPAGRWTPRSIYTLSFLTVIYAFNTADRNMFGLLMPPIKSDMHLSDTMLGFMSGAAFALFYAIAGVPVARLADRWSRRNIIAIGFTIWSLMTIWTGFAKSTLELAVARFLLGAGEAGGLAPSNSMIGDLFEKTRRTLALSILQTANAIGILVGFPIIGWIARSHGWRTAFVCAGLPGLFLAAIFFFTVREPRHGEADGASRETEPVNLIETLKRLLASRSYVLVVLASMLVAVTLFGVQAWLPTFLTRVHHLNSQEIGAAVGLFRGPAGILGAVIGGLTSSTLGRRDERWLVWTPAAFIFLIGASDFLMLYSNSEWGWKAGMALDIFFSSAQVGPVFALLLSAADARSRAIATALSLLATHLFGLAGGPLVVGMLNDFLHPVFGDGAIRYSITAVSSAAIIGSFVCLAAGRRKLTDIHQS